MSININPGHIARHTPPRAGAQGQEAAIIDIAQDLLLRHLHNQGILDRMVFKGGTALRKLYAGTAGRFSLDLDFSTANIGDDPDNVLTELISIWVDAHGVTAGTTNWKPGHESLPFDPQHWLRDRSKEFDTGDIGALTIPIPTPAELSDVLQHHYSFLAELDPDEQTIAHTHEQDRPKVLRLLAELPGERLDNIGIY